MALATELSIETELLVFKKINDGPPTLLESYERFGDCQQNQ
jgi:hypothetical protein